MWNSADHLKLIRKLEREVEESKERITNLEEQVARLERQLQSLKGESHAL